MNTANFSASRILAIAGCCLLSIVTTTNAQPEDDYIAKLQSEAVANKQSPLGYWGTDPDKFISWSNHSNRLIPVYVFGASSDDRQIGVQGYSGEYSKYRSEAELQKLYGRVPQNTVNPNAEYMDQTDITAIQRAAAAAGRKYIFLVIFDGMDWTTTRATAIYNTQSVNYSTGKGSGTHFQNYQADGTSQFGFMVTSPHNDGTDVDVNTQSVNNPGGKTLGGYDPQLAGSTPWDEPADVGYLIGKPADGNVKHAFTDSASSATSMTAGIKTYNAAINVNEQGERVSTIAHELQEQGWAVGAVSSVPISHATPAAAYAHNVTRQDYQDISRDMLGLPSISHPDTPLPGMDVVIGGGFGKSGDTGASQGENYESGNVYLAESDLKKVAVRNGGKYVVAARKEGVNGMKRLKQAAASAAKNGHRLLGFYGDGETNGHLPFQTANGDFQPVKGLAKNKETYTPEDLDENPSLTDMTAAAIKVLSSRKDHFWLMVEAGDVDWANHDNNIDCSIGAVNSGDSAVKCITDWVEKNSNWQESIVIVTSDHGHMFQLTQPELLIAPKTPDQK